MVHIEQFIKRHPYGTGLIFLNGSIGFFLICFPIAAVLALILVTVLEAFVAYCIMGLYFKIYFKFRVFLAWFAAANVVSTVAGVMLLLTAGDHPLIADNGEIGILIAFFLCFVISVIVETFVVVGFLPGNLDGLKRHIVSIGHRHPRKGTDSIGFEMATGVVFANMISYFMFLMIPVVYEIMQM